MQQNILDKLNTINDKIQQDPSNIALWNEAGMLLLTIDEDATAIFKVAYELEPSMASASNYSEALRRKERYADAIEVLSPYTKTNNTSILYNLALNYTGLGDKTSAIRLYNKLLKIAQDDNEALCNLANIYSDEARYTKAKELYIKAMTNGYFNARVNLINCLIKQGEFIKALNLCVKQGKKRNLLLLKDDSILDTSIIDFHYLLNLASLLEHLAPYHASSVYNLLLLNFANQDSIINASYYYLRLSFDTELSERLREYTYTKGVSLYHYRYLKLGEDERYFLAITPHLIEELKAQNKPLLIRFEQGFGDSILYLRYLGLLDSYNLPVKIYLQPKLRPLYQRLVDKEGYSNITLLDSISKEEEEHFLKLPSLLSLDKIYEQKSDALGVLKADFIKEAASLPLLNSQEKVDEKGANNQPKRKLRIGICTTTNRAFVNHKDKALALRQLGRYLVNSADVEYYNFNIEYDSDASALAPSAGYSAMSLAPRVRVLKETKAMHSVPKSPRQMPVTSKEIASTLNEAKEGIDDALAYSSLHTAKRSRVASAMSAAIRASVASAPKGTKKGRAATKTNAKKGKKHQGKAPLSMTFLKDELVTFEDTARYLSNMDLVISVDTSLSNLAESMGIRTFLLVPFRSDFRYGVFKDYVFTPTLFPHTTAFRQFIPNDWDKSLGLLNKELREFIK